MIELARFDASEHLDNEDIIREFLNAAAAGNDPGELLRALETVAKARAMTELSRKAGIPRASLYRVMNNSEMPTWQDVYKISSALGIVLPERQSAAAVL